MNNKILQLVFKKYWNNQELTTFEASALEYYLHRTMLDNAKISGQEYDYFTKLALTNF